MDYAKDLDVHVKGQSYGDTALHYAAFIDDVELTRMLVEFDASLIQEMKPVTF